MTYRSSKLHDDLDGWVVITVLKSMARAKSQEKNDEFPMTKAEGMTNDQTTSKTRFFVIGALGFFRHPSFVIRHFLLPVMIALKNSLGSDFVERVRAFFSENGPLSKAKNFEFRPQQQEMAAAVANALEEERHLVIEAGTGVGKSLAYLMPAILLAIEQHKKAIVSTHTINLQEQLLYKDIPILQKILPVEFKAALIKGRQNYLCPRRLERALQQANELFTGPEQNELNRLAEWARTTCDGSLSDLSIEPDPKVWIQVCSEAHICTQKTCGQDSRCFYQQARKRLLGADVLVINHTLLFILLISPEVQEERESGFIFPNDFLILDEAHTVEQVASRQIGIGISQYGLRSTIQRLYNARTRKGLFTVTRDAEGVRLAAELVDDAEEFFAAVESRCDFKKGREFRVRRRRSCSRHDHRASGGVASAGRRSRKTSRRRVSKSRITGIRQANS